MDDPNSQQELARRLAAAGEVSSQLEPAPLLFPPSLCLVAAVQTGALSS